MEAPLVPDYRITGISLAIHPWDYALFCGRGQITMVSQQAIAFEGEYLHIRASSDFAQEDRLDFWQKVVTTCEEHQCFKILGESSRAKPLETMEAYDIYKMFSEAGVCRKYRIAWVVRSPANVEPVFFTETVLRNRTFTTVRAFADDATAKR